MWLYSNSNKEETITSIEQIPSNAIGFIYLVTFKDETKYIGKKNLYSIRKVKSLKSGKEREGVVKQEYRNTGKGHRECYDVIKKESDWLKYQGSHIECKRKEVDNKVILQFAYSKLELTYLETKYLFTYGVLESDHYLNDNILGTFYRQNLIKTLDND